MLPLPYFEILKKALEITRNNSWLWVFGLFIGGTTGVNIGWFNFLWPPFSWERWKDPRWGEYAEAFQAWVLAHPQKFSVLLSVVLVLALLLVILSGWSKGALIWAAAKFAKPADESDPRKEVRPTLGQSLKNGRQWLWQIIGLQVFLTSLLVLLLVFFALPIIYLLSFGALGRVIVLSFLALVILIPVSIVFGFVHIYGPITLVLYNLRIGAAVQLAFSLFREKMKESIILAAFFIGLSMLFVLALVFSIILVSLPVGFAALVLWKFGLYPAFYALIFSTAVLSIIFVIALSAAFVVFQNVAWVLAVLEMIKTRKLPAEAKKALAAEPAA